MDSEQEQSFCFSHLEDDLHSFTNSLFVGDVAFEKMSQELDVYCETTAESGSVKPLVVTGGLGVGKSAGLANWTARRKANAPSTKRLDYAECVFYHAIGCSRLSTQVTHLLRRVVNELIVHFELKETMDLADEKLPWILPRLLERASNKGRVIIVISGGLEHICSNDKDYGIKWLPLSLPQNVRMILSASTPDQVSGNDHCTDHSRKRQTKVQQTWSEIHRRKWPTLPLDHVSVADFVESYLALTTQCSKEDTLLGEQTQVIETAVTHPSANNPFFITLMARGICHAVSLGYNVNQCLVAWMPCCDADSLLEHMLSIFESGMIRNKYLVTRNVNPLGSLLGDSFSLLFVARHGLHENELFELLSRVEQQKSWKSQTKGTVVPVKLKILNMLMQRKNRLIDIFRSFDTDGNGTLDHDEFYRGMERLDINVSHEEITQLINEVDNNCDG
mmetsp:Transcript_18807/g.45178  ORF Transcript_18807/g.45178 Transcript_18807/m.45178 type:complete len:447 (-) Transcript_18807:56-1396(-)